MRYSRMQGKPSKSKTTGSFRATIAILIILAISAAVYFIGAAKVGNFISDNLITPVISWFTGASPTPAPETSTTPDNNDKEEPKASASNLPTESITLSGGKLYSLQVGVFGDSSNAQALSDNIKNKGGAGYIYDDDQNYRVLIAGYKTEDDAKSVKDRLLSDQNMETKLFIIDSEEVVFNVSAEKDTLANIKNAISNIGKCEEFLLELSISFDKKEKTIEQTTESLNQLKDDTQSILSLVDKTNVNVDNNIITAIVDYYEGIDSMLDGLISKTSELELSSSIKGGYIEAAVLRQSFASTLV